jgi:hypothetical protein
MIAAGLVRDPAAGRSLLLLTGRREHLLYFAAMIESVAKHALTVKGAMGKK